MPPKDEKKMSRKPRVRIKVTKLIYSTRFEIHPPPVAKLTTRKTNNMKKNDKKIMNGMPNGFPPAPRRTTPPQPIKITTKFKKSDFCRCEKVIYFVVCRCSLIVDNELCYYVKDAYWSLSINDACFFSKKEDVDKIFELNKDLKLSLAEVILQTI
jgi:hypothetical protein